MHLNLINITVFVLLSVTLSFAQTTFPEGIYTSKQELLDKSPSMPNMLLMKHYPDNYRYTFEAPAKELKKRFIRSKIWGISDGTHLYLNGFKIEFEVGQYYRVEHEGKYLLFQGGLPKGDAALIAFGGGAIAYALAAQSTWLYAWNLETEQNFKINQKVLTQWLEGTPDIQEQYKIESHPKDMDVIIRYASLRNEAYAIDSDAEQVND